MMHSLRLTVVYTGVLVALTACGGGVVEQIAESVPDGADGNSPPSISGVPARDVREGEMYSFTPTVTDQENDALTFSIANKPDWLDFDEQTGALSGMPGEDHVGSYADIQIMVTEMETDVSIAMDSFDLNVYSTSATLSWAAPATRADGSPLPLSELGGFKIYAGTNADNLALLVDLDDPAATEYKVTDLAPATYFYAVTAYNVHGDESDTSNLVSKTIN